MNTLITESRSYFAEEMAVNTGILQKAVPTNEPERVGGYAPPYIKADATAALFMLLVQENFTTAAPDLLGQAFSNRPLPRAMDPSLIGERAHRMNDVISSKQSAFPRAQETDFRTLSN